jgi:long-chain acyl-CoA synthetase
MARTTILEYLDNFQRHAGETAYVHHRGYRMQRWTYGDVLANAHRFARELDAREIAKGDKVLIWGQNCAEWVVVFFGCLLRGVIVVPIDNISTSDFAQRVAGQVDARLCVCSSDNQLAGVPVLQVETLRERIAVRSEVPVTPPPLTRDDIVEIVFTSGTTAEPRGVVLSHGNILANLEPLDREIGVYLRYERIFHPLRFLNLLPLSHVFGQFLGIFLPQLLAATVIFQDTLNPAEVMRIIKRERVSVVVAVPRLMESLKDKILRDLEAAGRLASFQRQFAAKDQHFVLRWWRFRQIHNQFGWKFWAFISGGAALDADTEEFWRRLSFVVIQGYGLTETTSLISLNHPFRTGKRSIGKVLEGREIKLDENGEILVRGANVTAGYWQGNHLTPVLNDDGWFRTGDLGELDAEGNLYFKGRKKNVIVTREGMNVYPDDLEAALRQQPEVRDCVVVGLEHGGNAEACAVFILRDSADPDAVVRRANRQLAEYQQMRRWLLWPEQDFPRTPTQKPKLAIIQQAVQQHFASGDGGAPPAQGGLAELITRITGRSVGALAPDAKLEDDLNLNSMDRVELMSALEDRYQVEVNDADFTHASTVADLEQLLHGPLQPARSRYRYPRWAQRWPIPWIRTFIYYLLTWPATLIMAHPRIVGSENLRGVEGPVLITCNHITYIDIGFVQYALTSRLRHKLAVGMWGELLWKMWRPPSDWNPFRRWAWQAGYWLVLALFNVFPLPQQSGVRESFAYAGESVDRGYTVMVFPEGVRTPDGKPSPFQSGVGMLAARLDIPVVPMRIDGLYEMKMAGHKIARPGELTVTVGKPVRFVPETPAEEITRQIEQVTWTM